MSTVRVPKRHSLGPAWLAALASIAAVGTLLFGAAPAQAVPAGHNAATVQSVAAALLTPVQARRATGFRSALEADLMAGEQGRSCYGSTPFTCDAWFTTERTSTPYPLGVAITVTGSAGDAQAELDRLAAAIGQRAGDRVLSSSPGLLVTYETGLAVGPDLTPAVNVSVHRVRGSLVVMGSCQVQQRRLRLPALRSCAQRLQQAQALQASPLA